MRFFTIPPRRNASYAMPTLEVLGGKKRKVLWYTLFLSLVGAGNGLAQSYADESIPAQIQGTPLSPSSKSQNIASPEVTFRGKSFSEWKALLSDVSENTRIDAITAIIEFRSPDLNDKILSLLLISLRDPDVEVRNTAAISVASFGESAW